MAEELGMEGRGKFYDDTGAIRDVIENHMLQVVAFLGMEGSPAGFIASRFATSRSRCSGRFLRSIQSTWFEDSSTGTSKKKE